MSKTERVSRSDAWRQEFIRSNRARCHYCNRSGSLETGPDERPWWIDHMRALARGEPDTDDNLVLACKRCNLAKGVKPYQRFADFARAAFWVPDDWRASEGDLDELIDLYTASQPFSDIAEDRAWRVDGGRRCIVVTGTEDATGNFAEPILELPESIREDRTSSRSKGYWDSLTMLEFIVRTRELLPSLVAEVRLLRGEADVAPPAPADKVPTGLDWTPPREGS